MKKSRVGLLLIAALLFASLFLASGASALESTCPSAVIAAAALSRGTADATVFSDANKTQKLGKLTKGDVCQIIGAKGNFYRIIFGETEGYVAKSRVEPKGIAGTSAWPGSVHADIRLDQYVFSYASLAESFVIRGDVQADAPLDTLFVYLWDERLQRMEHTIVLEVKKPAANLDITNLCKTIKYSSITAGRKTLVIQGASDGNIVEIYRAPVYICGALKAVRNINGQCAFSAGEQKKDRSGWSWEPSDADESLTVTLPRDGSATVMTLEWQAPAEAFTVTVLDGDGQILSEETKTTGFYADAVALPPEARQARLSLKGQDNLLRNLCVYDANHPDNTVQQWQPVAEKLDLMVISPHQDDELLFLGGTIPYACQKGLDVGVVYMADCGRDRYAEALDGLWTAGLRNHPIFMGWTDRKVRSTEAAMELWSQDGMDPQKEMVRLIRKYRPEVIVGPDLEGEYGHKQHRLTANLVAGAIPLAMDASYDPESAEEYGAWEVKKVYLHLYPENRIEMDWNQPFAPDSPISPIFLAKEAYDKHASQHRAYSMNRQAVTYDNKIFGLYYTAVGPDEAKNDFFEHLDLQ